MPYAIRKVGGGKYKVVNATSGRVLSKHTSLSKARAQVRMLNAREHRNG